MQRLCLRALRTVAQSVRSGASPLTALGYYALQTLKEIPYAKWREYDVEDTVRFYSLRLREAGMIKSAPNEIIAQGADWRLFSELKRELKG